MAECDSGISRSQKMESRGLAHSGNDATGHAGPTGLISIVIGLGMDHEAAAVELFKM
jgi:hypothetical protein